MRYQTWTVDFRLHLPQLHFLSQQTLGKLTLSTDLLESNRVRRRIAFVSQIILADNEFSQRTTCSFSKHCLGSMKLNALLVRV